MFRIGEFSKMSKTTIKTLRFYDETGLLRPEKIDEVTGYRLYTTDQMVKLHKIQAIRQTGISVEETRIIMTGVEARRILEKRRDEIISEIRCGQDQLSRIEFILSGKEEELIMDYQATVKKVPECIVYSKKMVVPDYDAYFDVIPAIGQAVAAKYPDLKCTVPGYCFIIYHDGEYREKNINVELCEAVDCIKPDFDDIVFRKIEATDVVSVMHKGDYSGLGNAYAFIFKWIEENGYKMTGDPRESYIDGIWNKTSEDDWLTELQVPVAAK